MTRAERKDYNRGLKDARKVLVRAKNYQSYKAGVVRAEPYDHACCVLHALCLQLGEMLKEGK